MIPLRCTTGAENRSLPSRFLARRRKLLLGLATAGGAVALLALGLAVGRPALVVFWASWCEPCVRAAPALERFSLSPFGRGAS